MTKRLKLAGILVLVCLAGGLAIFYFTPPPSAEAVISSYLPEGTTKLEEHAEGTHLLQLFQSQLSYAKADKFYEELLGLSGGDPQVMVRQGIIPGILDAQTTASARSPGKENARVFVQRTPRSMVTVQITAPASETAAKIAVSCLLQEDQQSPGFKPANAGAIPVPPRQPPFGYTNSRQHSSVSSQQVRLFNSLSGGRPEEVASFYQEQKAPGGFILRPNWTNANFQSSLLYRLTPGGLDLVAITRQEGSTNTSIQEVQIR